MAPTTASSLSAVFTVLTLLAALWRPHDEWRPQPLLASDRHKFPFGGKRREREPAAPEPTGPDLLDEVAGGRYGGGQTLLPSLGNGDKGSERKLPRLFPDAPHGEDDLDDTDFDDDLIGWTRDEPVDAAPAAQLPPPPPPPPPLPLPLPLPLPSVPPVGLVPPPPPVGPTVDEPNWSSEMGMLESIAGSDERSIDEAAATDDLGSWTASRGGEPATSSLPLEHPVLAPFSDLAPLEVWEQRTPPPPPPTVSWLSFATDAAPESAETTFAAARPAAHFDELLRDDVVAWELPAATPVPIERSTDATEAGPLDVAPEESTDLLADEHDRWSGVRWVDPAHGGEPVEDASADAWYDHEPSSSSDTWLEDAPTDVLALPFDEIENFEEPERLEPDGFEPDVDLEPIDHLDDIDDIDHLEPLDDIDHLEPLDGGLGVADLADITDVGEADLEIPSAADVLDAALAEPAPTDQAAGDPTGLDSPSTFSFVVPELHDAWDAFAAREGFDPATLDEAAARTAAPPIDDGYDGAFDEVPNTSWSDIFDIFQAEDDALDDDTARDDTPRDEAPDHELLASAQGTDEVPVGAPIGAVDAPSAEGDRWASTLLDRLRAVVATPAEPVEALEEFNARFERGLRFRLSEQQVVDYLGQGVSMIAPEAEAHLLLGGEGASLAEVTTVGQQTRPGCGVADTDLCPAIVQAETLRFDNSTFLDACPFLSSSGASACAAVCVPIGGAGAARGVVHVTTLLNAALPDPTVEAIERAAGQVGDRLLTLGPTRHNRPAPGGDPALAHRDAPVDTNV